MSKEIFFWLVPGVISYWLYIRRKQNPIPRTGQDLIIAVGMFSVSATVITQLLFYAIRKFCSVDLPENLFDSDLNLKTVTAWLVSMPIGYFYESIFESFVASSLKFNPRVDPYNLLSNELIEKFAVVSLKNGKVYIGIVLKMTYDAMSPAKVIQLLPYASGFRSKESLNVTINTKYATKTKSDSPKMQAWLMIPFTELSSIAVYDQELHDQFVKDQVLVYDFEQKS